MFATDDPRDDPDLVDPALGCPRCGERHVDSLVWQDDSETVECQTCGLKFRPGQSSES